MINRLTLNRWTKLTLYFIIALVLVITIYPIFWALMASFKSVDDSMANPPYAMPVSIYWGNYHHVMTQSQIPRYFLNSAIIAVATLTLSIILSAPAAFALSKIRFAAADRIVSFFLMGMMVPVFICLIPMFKMYKTLGLRNTYWAVILPEVGFGLPSAIFLYQGFLKYISNNLCEAAVIDGASSFQVFLHVIFPMAKNTTVSILTLKFVSVWNEFTYANTFLTSSTMKTLPIGLNDFVEYTGYRDWGATFAGIIISVMPTMIIYYILNKHVIQGMSAGALKT